MAKKLNVSFKNNDNDKKLLEEINLHSDKSAFIKEAVQFYIKFNSTILLPPLQQTDVKKLNSKDASEILNIMG